jgi:hypothetical protein
VDEARDWHMTAREINLCGPIWFGNTPLIREMVHVVHDRATDVTENKPEYCLKYRLCCLAHANMMP